MLPPSWYASNLHLAFSVRDVPGAIVECGTWRGGMIAGIADVLGSERSYYLFDSFEGLPQPQQIDGEVALDWAKNVDGPTYFDNCRASQEEAELTMSKSRARSVTVVKGWFEKTLPAAKVGPIALLRLDADWYDSTKTILENLGHLVVPNGVILVDDYYVFQGCCRAVNEYASTAAWKIRQHWRGGVCYVIR